jgi:type I restriction enzyme M protein
MTEIQNTERFDYENEIWKIADYVRDIIKRSEYNRIVLPFSLLRRLECALEPTRDAVCEVFEQKEAEWGCESDNYCQTSKKPFYNITSFRLNNLGATDTFDALMEYINGFSPNAREIFTKFKIENTAKALQEGGLLYEVCRRFSTFDLSPDNVSDREMSDIYEHLIQRYGESIAEDAEDFMTPKDIVRLSVEMLFANDDELLNSDTGAIRTMSDPTVGTGGFICDALDLLDEWHKDKKMKAPTVIVPYAQEIEGESWAVAKANLMLRNVSNQDKDQYDSIKDMSAHVAFGDTLAEDAFPNMTFNYQLSNPPYGKKWLKSKSAVEDEAKLGFKGRFGAGLPPINDGSMLFLQHVCNKMAPISEGGGKAGIVLSGSPLFTGDAGSGCSNIRRWIFEKDYIDCIVKLGTEEFFRTGINTYLWILSNNKPENRKGYIQLIDASDLKTPIRKNIGNKRYEMTEEQRSKVVNAYINGEVNEYSVIVPTSDFMFRQVTTYRPLRAEIHMTPEKASEMMDSAVVQKLTDNNKTILRNAIIQAGTTIHPYGWETTFAKDIRSDMEKPNVSAPQLAKAVRDVFMVKGSEFPIIKDKKGNIVPDPDSKDSENIGFDETFEAYMNREVLPYAPETFIDETVIDKGPLQDGKIGVVGTNISFNKYFYHYEAPRKPEDIASEIENLESELSTFMRGIFDE